MNFRLVTGGRIDRNVALTFSFDGREYQGFAGDTLASALLANGETLVARSSKYHRPRGISCSGVEEPSALVQLYEREWTVPNARMTEVELIDGLKATSVNTTHSARTDLRAMQGWFSRLMPAGFYYKTFMASQRRWHFFEPYIRRASGLGRSPELPDPDRYSKRFAHADVLVVGAGIAGISAALAAGRAGARVILCDEQAEPGGWLLSSDETIDGAPGPQWVSQRLAELSKMPEVHVLPRTTAFGFHDHGFVTLNERSDAYSRPGARSDFRERVWKVRTKRVVLATGAHERPLVFGNNDLPGVMLASAVSTYVRRYAVLPGRNAIVFTTSDMGYDAALALADAGAFVQVVDARSRPDGPLTALARKRAVPIWDSSVVVEALGRNAVRGALTFRLGANGNLSGQGFNLECDLIAVSGGSSPAIHLHCHAGGRPVWSESLLAFVPGEPGQGERFAGACRGLLSLYDSAIDGANEGAAAAREVGFAAVSPPTGSVRSADTGSIRALWRVPHPRQPGRGPKQFVDLQNDVTAADLLLAVREGFESIEHVKRYTALGLGTDQGKTGNINGMGIVAAALGKSLAEVGTTTFRPNYTPVSFGAIAGLELGDGFEPVRTTPMHAWHLDRGACFEDVGQWKRPWYFPRPGEVFKDAVCREVLAARYSVAMLDASTLGKIDIQGPDAVALLDWIYCNGWSTLGIGRCRYGLMLDENGMVFDDGVTVRLSENHFLMHTTTGGAARVMAWMERWLQTEWSELRVYLTSVTDHWSTTAVVGPNSRQVIRRICDDVNFADDAFPFMSWRQGTVAGVSARIMRISFSGERSYEINVPAQHGLQVWRALYAAGEVEGITPYGTETLHVLRAEKGFIIVGQDTDGSVTPNDLGMQSMVSKTKDFLGRRSLSRSDTQRPDRKQLVGLLTEDPQLVLPEGSHVLDSLANMTPPVAMAGHVTSSYSSPTLGRSIALALVRGGRSRIGQRIQLWLREGGVVSATVVDPVFYDREALRQNA